MNPYENIDCMLNDLPPSTWYRISKNVEYSTDFDFFFKNQILVVRSNITYSFCSRLESKIFETKKAIFGNHELSDEEVKETCKKIHQEILDGKHGKGKIVN